MHKDNAARLHEKLKLSAAEITKGNDIISRLQSECRELKGKLRLKATVLVQQQARAHSARRHRRAPHSARALAAAPRSMRRRLSGLGRARPCLCRSTRKPSSRRSRRPNAKSPSCACRRPS